MKKKIIKSKVKKLKFSAIVEDLREHFSKLKDARKKPNYPIEDVVISVFAMMFFQDPSLLKFQERMLLKHNRTNLETIFGVKKIPCDNQIRNILDKVDSDVLQKISFKLLSHLQRSGKLKEFINLEHELILLSNKIEWTYFEKGFKKYLMPVGNFTSS